MKKHIRWRKIMKVMGYRKKEMAQGAIYYRKKGYNSSVYKWKNANRKHRRSNKSMFRATQTLAKWAKWTKIRGRV